MRNNELSSRDDPTVPPIRVRRLVRSPAFLFAGFSLLLMLTGYVSKEKERYAALSPIDLAKVAEALGQTGAIQPGDVAPDAVLSSLRTFHVVEAAEYLGDTQPGETRPPFANAATSRALGQDIAADLEGHGYTANDQSPDVLVEYGTAVREADDPTDESYNYVWRGKDWRGWGPGPNDATPAEYNQGAVIIDVVDARTKQLLWRGHGPADASDDVATSVKHLDQAVNAILDHFPQRSLALSQASSR